MTATMGSYELRVSPIWFQFSSLPTTVCHRVVRLKAFNSNEWGFMTKGDDNKHDDRWLLSTGSNWIKPDQLRGLVRIRIPHVGLPVLIIKETFYGKVSIFFKWNNSIDKRWKIMDQTAKVLSLKNLY